MAVFLFTFHAYRSWMPDHPKGYNKRGVGYLPPDPSMARQYEANANHAPTLFDRTLQRTLIEHILTIPTFIDLDLHAITTEPSHVHILCAWHHDRSWESMRNSIKRSITLKLADISSPHGPLRLSRGASRKRVLDRDHFDHLMHKYLPKHQGVSRFVDRGWTNDAT